MVRFLQCKELENMKTPFMVSGLKKALIKFQRNNLFYKMDAEASLSKFENSQFAISPRNEKFKQFNEILTEQG